MSYPLFKSSHFGHFGMSFYVSYHRYSRMLNYLLSYIVFHEWKCGAIKRNQKDKHLSLEIYSSSYLLYKSSHFGKLFYVYATDIPECSTMYLITLSFALENMVQSEEIWNNYL